MKRWCIFIDILGFSKLWESNEYQALHSLRELMRAIFRLEPGYIRKNRNACSCIKWEMALPS